IYHERVFQAFPLPPAGPHACACHALARRRLAVALPTSGQRSEERLIMRCGVAFVLLGATAHSLAAETPLPDDPLCPTCTLQARSLRTLGDTDGPGSLSGPAKLIADGRGRFWLLQMDTPPMVFDSVGRFVREFSRGEGPGEFVSPTGLLLLP